MAQELLIRYDGPSSVGLLGTLENTMHLNLHSIGVVRVLSTGPGPVSADASAIVGGLGGMNFISLNVPNARVCLDLRKWLILPSHYLVDVNPNFPSRLLSWVLEASNDGRAWTCLDERRLSVPKSTLRRVYCCRAASAFRVFRLTQTGLNSIGTHQLVLQRFDLFGRARHNPAASDAFPGSAFM
jgi:hypothetical protein